MKPNVIRFAIIGTGMIAETAVLPALAKLRRAQAVALVSPEPARLKALGKKYSIPELYSADNLDACLNSENVDAVYIAVPNDLHCDFAIRAARAGKHILCEKPLALTVAEARRMQAAAHRHGVKLMTAYRLHFEAATRATLALAHSGKLGDVRSVSSTFGFSLTDHTNSRFRAAQGGGSLYDIGIYCINAARHIFQAEPIEVFATMPPPLNRDYREVDESVTAVLSFPEGRIATFTVSFSLAQMGRLEIFGTRGRAALDPSYYFVQRLRQIATYGGKTKERTYPWVDQFATMIDAFVGCIGRNQEPSAGADEGIADLRVVEALQKSARLNRPVKLR